ncbi:hypothetical protein U9M48_038687 [Paspalum notatum var. saurae]|uniref:RBR-type E3 ubiquitin transferase n=1 Tax=Paspalum notatum var. saurae TaxID=547442 RepID=A0AAQ3XBB2_PASNO
MAAGSSSDALVALVDDIYFSVLAHGRNDADDDELFPISDEKYAAELQLQEVILSSAIAAAARSSSSSSVAPAPPRISTPAAAISVIPIVAGGATLDRGKGECSYASSSSSSRPSLRVAVALVFCKICMDAVPPSDAHRASRGCAHAFCGGCLARYVGAKTQDRIADVRCPEGRCGGVLDPELCQGILPREVFERWGAALCESMLLGAKRVYCPYRDCSAVMLVDDGDDAADVAKSECPSCRRIFCARCAVAPWHAGVTCAEYGRLRKGDRGREDMLLVEMAKGKKWKRCPKCEYFVEKRDGCLHITCRCGFQFCYGCGGSWGTTHSRCTMA